MASGLRISFQLLCLLLLVGCGGEEDAIAGLLPGKEPPADKYAMFNSAAAEHYRARSEFSYVALSSEEEAALRAQFGQNASCENSANPKCARASAYELQNIHLAHAARLPNGKRVTGAGTLIAIMDNGFRTSHQELSGKSITRFLGKTSALSAQSHGTAVAAIAAGKADGQGMMGVAPDASLHLSSWDDPAQANLLSHMAAATEDAGKHQAVVQNNSWGWADQKPANAEQHDFAASGLTDYAEHIATWQGGAAQDWKALFSAYDDFQKEGVIVFANSNNTQLGDASAWAALPLFEPTLSEAWITVSNALFSVEDDTGKILDAELMSAPCGAAGSFCVTTDGSLRAPTRSSDNAYQIGTGSSFAAPQVSGQIALLAQAFPDLSPAEWTARLLATAQRGWEGFRRSVAGEVTFAPGVHREYSRLYGHGIPDIKAALSPVGGLSIASGKNVFTSARTSLNSGIATSAPVIGNSIAKAIADKSVMVVDRLGTDFYIKGKELGYAASQVTGSGVANKAIQRLRQMEKFDYRFSQDLASDPLSASLHDVAQAKLFFSQNLGFSAENSLFSQVFPLGIDRFLQFSGRLDQRATESAASFMLSRIATHERFTSELSFAFGQGTDQIFGGQTQGPFMAASGSGNLSASLALNAPIGADWSLSGFAELGSGFAGATPEALVDYSTLAYASGGLVASRRNLFSRQDTLGFYAGIRPTTVAGRADIRLPVGRDKDGTILYEKLGINLAQADLPLRFGLSYQNRTWNDFDLRFNANADLNAGSQANEIFNLAVSLGKAF